MLLDRHREELTARIRQRLPPRLDRKVAVSDVLQESCLVAFRRREDLEDRGGNAFRNWLLGIVDLKARESIRNQEVAARRSARREVTRSQRRDTGQFAGDQPTPSQVVIGAELADLARRAAAALPEDYRTILRLAREEGLSLGEAAERMRRSREAVKKLYGRALCRFRKVFDRMRGESDV
jgi:RNA polymerase sigma factor (sigma-70 family)